MADDELCANDSDSIESADDIGEKSNENLVSEVSELKRLKTLSFHELLEMLTTLKEENSMLAKENEICDSFLKEEEYLSAQITVLSADADEDDSSFIDTESFLSAIKDEKTEDDTHVLHTLSYPEKCYVANKKLEQLTKHMYDLHNSQDMHALIDLQLQLDALNMYEAEIIEAKQDFHQRVRVEGRHPVTRKIIAQKVSKYFDDSLKKKMTWTEKYRMQIESDKIQRYRLLSQIKEKEEMTAKVDAVEFQKVKYECMKSNKLLAVYHKKQNDLRRRFNRLLTIVLEQKKSLKTSESHTVEMQTLADKTEHLKEVILAERLLNDKKANRLKNSMRKIKFDPRRHNLPTVMDYAVLKSQQEEVRKEIKDWEKKLAKLEQAKFEYLNELRNKN